MKAGPTRSAILMVRCETLFHVVLPAEEPDHIIAPGRNKKTLRFAEPGLAWSRSSPPDEIPCLATRCPADRSVRFLATPPT
jgi:hypothetical protein